jgi:hypothetical protein
MTESERLLSKNIKASEYYVYLYKDLDGTPIYVGKGKGKRAFEHLRGSSNDRLNKFISARSNEGYTVEPEIVATGSEDNMLMVEVALIKLFGRADNMLGPLFNSTDGGDGLSNPSDEIRGKMSQAAFKRHGGERVFIFENFKTGEIFSGNCPQFALHLNKSIKQVNRFVSTSIYGSDVKSIDGWIIQGSGIDPNNYRTSFEFVHVGTGESECCSQTEFVEKFGVSPSLINQLVKNKIPHANGWVLKANNKGIQGLTQNAKGNWYTPVNPWRAKGKSEATLTAWAMSKGIKNSWKSLCAIDPDIRAIRLLRSMKLVDQLSARMVSTILDKLIDGSFDPDTNDDWQDFYKDYASNNKLPVFEIPKEIFVKRSNKWISSLEDLVPDAKPTQPHQKPVTINGIAYQSYREAAEDHGLVYETFRSRMSKGWTLEQAVGLIPPPPRRPHKNSIEINIGGVIYSSLSKAAKAYGLSNQKVHKRLTKFNWSIEQALDIHPPPTKLSNSAKSLEVRGVVYDSIEAACQAFSITVQTASRRRRQGMSLEEAICAPTRGKQP